MSKRLLMGPRFVHEALRGKSARSIQALYVEDLDRRDLGELLALAQQLGIKVEAKSRAGLDRLADGVRHQGVIAVAGEYVFAELEELLVKEAPLLVALDEITDPHNFGAIVRSSVAFGVDGILVPKHRSAPVTPVVVRASAGATEHARIAQVTNLQRTLMSLSEEYGLEIIGLDAGGDVTIDALEPAPAGRVLVVGSEGSGLRRMVRERCDHIASIPQTGDVESLNASVAAGVALYELTRARRGR